jgi:sigma-B regulation protein RsbU (phosphoserine phosphatase)
MIAVAGEMSISWIKRWHLVVASCLIAVLMLVIVALDPLGLIFFDKIRRALTAYGLTIVIITALLYLYDFIKSIIKYQKSGDSLYKAMAYTFMLMFFCDVSFMTVNHFYSLQSLLGYFYQLVSYIILFNLFFINGIQKPYMLLSQAKEDLNEYLAEMDKLVDQRTNELRCMNEKLMADQEIARGMQLAMLPASLPGNDYVAFSSFYIPAENLSGDFYNVFKIDEFRFGIYIGDVSGHGISAAMLSIFIFQKMQSLMEEKGGEGMTIPSVVLKHLYDSLNSANFNENMYVVMLYGVFDSQTGIFSYASGGLNTLPLRIRPDGSIQELDNDGFAICKLGELIKPKFINHQILLFPGDKLLIYTDGLIDARSREDSRPYSVERLKKAIGHNYKWGLNQLLESIKQDVQSYSTDKPPDDITLMAVDVLPPF